MKTLFRLQESGSRPAIAIRLHFIGAALISCAVQSVSADPFDLELNILKNRVDGLEEQVNELEASQFRNTPTTRLEGNQGSIAPVLNDENQWDAALRYAGEFGAFRVASRTKFLTGRVDRAHLQIPVKLDFNQNFVSVPGFSLSDTKYYGWEQEFEVPLFGHGNYSENEWSLQLGIKWGRSSYDAGGLRVDAQNSGATNSALLDPSGLAGDFGGGGIQIPNVMYPPAFMGFANHENIWGTSIYEEELYTLGIGKTCYRDERTVVRSSAALLYGNTTEGSTISGQTAIVGGVPNLDYQYQNELKTDRFGLQLGIGVEYQIGEVAGRPLSVYLDGKVRYIYNDAEGESSAMTRGLLSSYSRNTNIDEGWSDFGFVGEAGVTIELSENTSLSAGFHAETWEIGSFDFQASEPFSIEAVDRSSVGAGFTFEVKF